MRWPQWYGVREHVEGWSCYYGTQLLVPQGTQNERSACHAHHHYPLFLGCKVKAETADRRGTVVCLGNTALAHSCSQMQMQVDARLPIQVAFFETRQWKRHGDHAGGTVIRNGLQMSGCVTTDSPRTVLCTLAVDPPAALQRMAASDR